jgi:asparagine synthase (glutamine-hydrolysing)
MLSVEDINYQLEDIQRNFNNIVGRGPDYSILKKINNNIFIGFHRLSINELTSLGNQPFEIEMRYHKYYLVCNGEIYNYKNLANDYKINLLSTSDCEILLPLYLKIGIDKLVEEIDGVFSLIIIKINKQNNKIEIISARDKIGVRPLFYGSYGNRKKLLLSSEMKGIYNLCDEIKVFTPGTIMSTSINDNNIQYNIKNYYEFKYTGGYIDNSEEDMLSLIRIYLGNSIKKRLMSDRPIGSLLSGGLDSSLVSALVAKITKKKIKTFSISMPGGTDQKYSEMVATYINSDHHNIELSKLEFLEAIEETIWAIESYDVTTVRASVGQFLVSKYISENTNIKVVMSGDGSDEVCSGYIYNYNAPSLDELHDEASKRIEEIHLYDGLRADRATSYHGLELRVPFLDHQFIDMYMKIDKKLRKPCNEHMEKYLLRKAFESENLLPPEVLWRKKEAFSDGVSSKEDSWHTTIKEYINSKVSDEEYKSNYMKYTHCRPTTKEGYYYRKVFCEKFGNNNSKVIPNYWLPKWCGDIKEPSARILDIYNNSVMI